MVVFGVFAMSLVVSRAENLTTLDGKTYTNAVFVTNRAHYATIKHDDGTAFVVISNLPVAFRTKYNLREQTNAPVAKANPVQANSIDLFLAQYRNSDLTVEKSISDSATNDTTHSWVLRVTPKGFVLTGYGWRWVEEKGSREMKNNHWVNLGFVFGEENLIRPIFDKFSEWESIASTNHAEPFQKTIGSYETSRIQIDGMAGRIHRVFTFEWGTYGASLSHSPTIIDPPEFNTTVFAIDISPFRDLLKSLPDLKEELAQKIQKREAEKNLFK